MKRSILFALIVAAVGLYMTATPLPAQSPVPEIVTLEQVAPAPPTCPGVKPSQKDCDKLFLPRMCADDCSFCRCGFY